MKNFLSFLRYHGMIWGKSIQETFDHHIKDLSNLIGNILVALISGITYAVWSFVQQKTMIDWLGVFVSVLTGFFGWALILLIYNLVWKIPAKLYRKKESEANKYTWKDVEIKRLKHPKDYRPTIALMVTNKKTCDIEKVSVKLIGLSKNWIPYEQLPLNFYWLTDGSAVLDNIVLPKNEEGTMLLKLADWSDVEKIAGFSIGRLGTDEKKDEFIPIQIEVGAIYRIKIEWIGEINGRILEKYTSDYSFKFDGSKMAFKEIYRNINPMYNDYS